MSKYNYDGTEQFRPISAWGYVGYSILFSIPIIGFILIIVFSLSDANINRRCYARSFLCWFLLSIIILIVVLAIGVFTGSLTEMMQYFENWQPL